jgi:hypothetical protein
VPLIVQQRALTGSHAGALAGAAAASRPRVVADDAEFQQPTGGEVVEVEYVGSGRSGADSTVFFPDLRVMAVGGLYTAGTPVPDCADGGSYAGWSAAIAHLMWAKFDLAVPSEGPPVGKPELLALKAKLDALAERALSVPAQSGCDAVGALR